MIQYDWSEKWAQYAADKVAVKEHETGRTLTYRQLNNVANRLANHFTSDLGLMPGDRVAILAENCLEHFILFFTAQKTGITLIPLNFRLAAREIDFQLQDGKPRLVIIEQKYRKILDGCASIEQIEAIRKLSELSDYCYSNRNQIVKFAAADLEEDDPVFILYTSGTTGVPKGALYTHKMLFWNSVNTTIRLDITSEERSVTCMPLFHTGGWNVVPTPFFHRGAYVCLTKRFEADTILQLLQDEKATMFMAVPTLLQMMIQSELFEKIDLSAMRFFVIGGEPMPLPLIEKWHGKGIPIRQGYGLTEVGPSVTSLHQDDAIGKIGSIGQPNFYVEARIVDDYDNDVEPDEIGELILKGPTATPGYWQNPKATQQTIKDGWFHTGDLVKRDSEGYIYVVDRQKNMYISGGENVYPAEVEKFLNSHPDIEQAAIIGVPDEKWGEAGKAFIVKKSESQLTEKEVIEFGLGNLAKYKIPKHIEFISEMPRNDAGKIDRKALLSIHLSTIIVISQ